MTALAGKVVLITGADGGFGKEMTRQFLAEGSNVILADLETATLPTTASEAPGARGRIIGHIAADLSTPEGADSLYEQAVALAPAIDVLIMNAGIAVSGVISDVPRAAWEKLIAVNLLGPMRVTAQFLPAMIERRRGHLVYISSVAGIIGTPTISAYSAAKFGLRGFGEAVAGAVKDSNIQATILYPFFSPTAIIDAPHYGAPRPELPTALFTSPKDVVSALVNGVKHDKLHVFPGPVARVLDRMKRYTPWVVPFVLSRQLSSKKQHGG